MWLRKVREAFLQEAVRCGDSSKAVMRQMPGLCSWEGVFLDFDNPRRKALKNQVQVREKPQLCCFLVA